VLGTTEWVQRKGLRAVLSLTPDQFSIYNESNRVASCPVSSEITDLRNF